MSNHDGLDIPQCPFCGSTDVTFYDNRHWTGMRWVLHSTRLQHHCQTDGYDKVFIEVRAKTQEEAAAMFGVRAQ